MTGTLQEDVEDWTFKPGKIRMINNLNMAELKISDINIFCVFFPCAQSKKKNILSSIYLILHGFRCTIMHACMQRFFQKKKKDPHLILFTRYHDFASPIICTTNTKTFFFFLQKSHCIQIYCVQTHQSRCWLLFFIVFFLLSWGFFSLLIMRVICLNQPHCDSTALHGSGEHISKCTGVHKPISRAWDHIQCCAAWPLKRPQSH